MGLRVPYDVEVLVVVVRPGLLEVWVVVGDPGDDVWVPKAERGCYRREHRQGLG